MYAEYKTLAKFVYRDITNSKMAYEFKTDASSEFPVAPEYWDSKGRIYHLLPDDPVFAYGYSVVQDPKTHQFAVDTNDSLPEPEQVILAKNGHIGLLKVMFGTPPTIGYLADLRYNSSLVVHRLLGLNDGGVSADSKVEETNKTVPILGALFFDELTGRTDFRFQRGKEEILEPYAESLKRFVDAERKRREVTVIGEKPETPSKDSIEIFSARTIFSKVTAHST